VDLLRAYPFQLPSQRIRAVVVVALQTAAKEAAVKDPQVEMEVAVEKPPVVNQLQTPTIELIPPVVVNREYI
jgi:hypothetical protein